MSNDFGLFLVVGKSEIPHAQVDLEGETIYRWYLVGLWADTNGSYESWSVELSYQEFWSIKSSDQFMFNKALLAD